MKKRKSKGDGEEGREEEEGSRRIERERGLPYACVQITSLAQNIFS